MKTLAFALICSTLVLVDGLLAARWKGSSYPGSQSYGILILFIFICTLFVAATESTH